MLSLPKLVATLALFLFISTNSSAAFPEEYGPNKFVTPLRLSYIEGEASFWRQGAPDWVEAGPNIPLAAGDALYTGLEGDLELQMGRRNFIRADTDTQFNLANQTADFIQFNVTSGRISFDLRLLPADYTVEVDTPNVVITIEHAGYYRVDVDADSDVHFTTRRGGVATLVPLGGTAMNIHPSEEIVVAGYSGSAQVETYAAPELDRWDHWNYERTESLIDTLSDRYIPYGISGVADLDHYGSWRLVPDYGAVWMPDSVPFGWAPYSSGRWSWDPDYQWTWIDDEPWGWAPFHYGRWVNLDGYWAWAPGPALRNPVYTPALVAFFNVAPEPSMVTSSAGVGWVALGWGEPVRPWWGKSDFVGRPSWNGWGGPKLINNRIINNNTNINVINITYNNIHVDNAVVATTHEHFGNGRVHEAPAHWTHPRVLEHIHGVLPVQPGPSSLVAGSVTSALPPQSVVSRPVMGTRPANVSRLPWIEKSSPPQAKVVIDQAVVTIPKPASGNLARPEFGKQTGEERLRPNIPPRFMERRHEIEPAVARAPTETPQVAPTPSRITTPEVLPQRDAHQNHPDHALQASGLSSPDTHRVDPAPTPPHAPPPAENRKQTQVELPGKPANRTYLKNKDKDKKDVQQQSATQKN